MMHVCKEISRLQMRPVCTPACIMPAVQGRADVAGRATDEAITLSIAFCCSKMSATGMSGA